MTWSNVPGLAKDLVQTFLQPTWLGGVHGKHLACWNRPDGRAVVPMEKLVEEGE